MHTVSVVIPTFNRLPLLRIAVSSVLGQTFRDLELIVVDDGSSDGTADYLASIGDPRVRYLLLPHSGNVARLRNAGAAQAHGQLLAFLDSDDLWDPRKLELQVAAMAGNVASWSYTRYEHVDLAGRPILARGVEWRNLSGRIAHALIETEASVSIVTALMSTRLFHELGGFNESLVSREDYEFLVRLALQANAVAISDTLAFVREHPDRSTHSLHGAMPFLVSARAYELLGPRLEHAQLRAAARRRRAHLLAEAARAHLDARAYRAAAICLVQATQLGASPRMCASAVGRGFGMNRNLVRRLFRAAWRAIGPGGA